MIDTKAPVCLRRDVGFWLSPEHAALMKADITSQVVRIAGDNLMTAEMLGYGEYLGVIAYRPLHTVDPILPVFYGVEMGRQWQILLKWLHNHQLKDTPRWAAEEMARETVKMVEFAKSLLFPDFPTNAVIIPIVERQLALAVIQTIASKPRIKPERLVSDLTGGRVTR